MTTTIRAFLADLSRQKVNLWIEDDQLRMKAPKGVITADVRNKLRTHKDEILQLLNRDVQKAERPSIESLTEADGSRPSLLPLSYAQQRLWFLDQLEGANATYSMPFAFAITGALQVVALEQAIQALIHRHEILRTHFSVVDGEPLQQIDAEPPFSLPVINMAQFASLPQAEQRIQLKPLLEQEATRPFDLDAESLLRVMLYRFSETSHVLFLNMHHIISDGWSLGIFLEELNTLYQSFVAGQPSPLSVPSLHYADFAQWQRAWLTDEVLAEQLTYWQEQLADVPTFLELPTDYPHPPSQTFDGNYLQFEVSPYIAQKLREQSQAAEATLFMTLYAAFAILLARYSRQEDIVIGTPIANRHYQGLESLIGFFVNTLPLHANLSDNPPFTQFLRQVRQTAFDAYDHQDIPFEHLVSNLVSERNLSHSPLVQVMFEYQEALFTATHLGNLVLERIEIETLPTKFDIDLVLEPQADGGLRGTMGYNTALFDQTTIEHMIGHYLCLLDGIVQNPDQPIYQLPLLTDSEKRQLLVGWNQTAAAYPTDQCFHTLFEEQVPRTPDAQAVVDMLTGDSLTYRDLNKRANQLAHHLQTLGVGTEQGSEIIVGVCMERCVESVISLLAIFKAGGVYVPLDPALPQNRLSYMLTHSQAKVVLTKTEYAHRISGQLLEGKHQAQLVHFDSDWSQVALHPTYNLLSQATPDTLAYIIYTSGSTGLPKGAMIEHRGMVNHLYTKITDLHLTVGDRIAATAPQSFDISIWQFLVMLLVGGTVHIFDNETVRNPHRFLQRIDTEKMTTAEIVPSLFRFLLDEMTTTLPRFSALRSLRLSGEALPPHLCREWFSHYPHIPLINGYGPTECTDETTYYTIEEALPLNMATIPIGRPIANAQVYILDTYMQPVPVGVFGELYVGGIGVGRGYFKDPERTAQAFMDDPFGTTATGRLYKTGDLVRYRPDGLIEFLGRLDHQVKIRGNRIELGEVETVLSEHPSVRQSLVIAHQNGPADYSLIAYVATKEQGANDESTLLRSATLRDYLAGRLPDYMLPATFILLDVFPLTPNGKVDRKALPTPDYIETDALYLPPQTPTEEVLATIWAEVLRLARVGRMDNFFLLGGHSLLAIQVISRLRKAFQIELSVRVIFESPTIAELATTIDGARYAKELPLPPPILPTPRVQEQLLPPSFAQQRLWFLDQLEESSATYNIPTTLRLASKELDTDAQHQGLQIDALEIAFNHLIQRHESLRTTFPAIDGQPMQRIHTEQTLAINVVDLQPLSDSIQQQELERLLLQDVAQPFDLAEGPLLRVYLYLLNHREQVLHFNIHHIIADDWSMNIFISELASFYQLACQPEAVAQDQESLPALPIQYADFALWQRDWLRGIVLETQLTFWRKQLNGVPTLLDLPTDHSRPSVQTFNGQMIPFELDAELATEMQYLCRLMGTSAFMTYYAVFAVLLSRYSGQTDLVVGTPIAHRQYQEIESLIGFFLNTLALRTDLSGDPTFSDLLTQVRQMTLDIYAHQDIPFNQLVEELEIERSLSHAPLFQVMFVWIDEVAPNGFGDIQAELMPSPAVTAKFDLTLFVGEKENGGGLRGAVEYSTDLFESVTIERMITHFTQLLHSAAANPQLPINQLVMLTQTDYQQIVIEWNNTAANYPKDQCLHHLFEEQAKRTPNIIAVDSGELRVNSDSSHHRTLTYAELNNRANQLAYHLRDIGVGPDVLVGLAMERSAEMMIGVLAILKAGGAYVPLDAAYPEKRLMFMQQDAKIKVLLTQSNRPVSTLAGVERICLDTLAATLAQMPTENLSSLCRPENLAYVIYTSGSTGQPKGVAMPHRALVNLMMWQHETGDAGVGTRTLQFTPISFDVSCQELFSTWCSGGTLVLVDDDTRRDGESLLAYLNTHKIQRLFLPFVALQQLAESASDMPIPTLREVITAGEQLQITPALQAWFSQANCTLHNQYGPTESHVVTAYTLPDDVGTWATLPPIGRPVANAQTYILDSIGNPLPIGVAGELHLGGDVLAHGYLHQPDLTAERFIANPLGPEGTRLYRTGDLARYQPDGNIEYLGRADDQVKIRGFRVELGEIELRISQHPAIHEAAVATHELESGVHQLVAYVVSDRLLSEIIANIRTMLHDQLPDYMIPAVFVQLDMLPLTPSGKVNRRALPGLEDADNIHHLSQGSGAVSTTPLTPTEEIIATVWSEVLGLAYVGRDDEFFDLGGHSLLATQVVSRLRNAFHIALPVRALFESSTISTLADAIDAARQAEYQLPIPPPIQRRVSMDADLAPLSFAQQRLWLLNEVTGPTATYSLPMQLRLQGNLNVSALERALGELVRRHEALRTTFPKVDGLPVQQIHPAQTFALPVISLTHFGTSAQIEALNRCLREEAERPFDLVQGPLMRACLYVLIDTNQPDKARGNYVLFLNLHHIIADGWSLGVLSQELDSLYQAFADEQPSPLADLLVQYADFAVWQRAWLSGEILEKQLTYWQQHLANAPLLLELPTDRPRPVMQTYVGATEFFVLDTSLAEELQLLCRRCGVSIFMALFSVYSVLLARYSRQEDVVIGSPLANRNVQEIESLIGFFVNTLPLRVDLSRNPTFEALLEQVRQVTLDAHSHQDIPFDRLIDELAIKRELSHTPLFQTVFMWQETEKMSLGRLGDLDVTYDEVATPTSKYDLLFALGDQTLGHRRDNSIQADSELWGGVEYNADLFNQATIQRMIGHFKQLLTAAVADPTQSINELAMLTSAERQKLLVDWNSTQTIYPAEKSIHQLFEEQVACTPDALAVVFGKTQLTYQELNHRANQLAYYLIQEGVGSETLVGICVERSLDMVVGLLGILKAGGAYVPLDPNYPPERLAFMLSDTNVSLLLSQEKFLTKLPSAIHAAIHATIHVRCLDKDWNHIVGRATNHALTNLEITVHAENLAYIMYTSGSTGRPKGVCVSHRSVVRLVRETNYIRFSSKEIFLQLAPISFDAATLEIWGPLLNGGQLIVMPPEQPSLKEIGAAIQHYKVTTMWLTSGLFHLMVDERLADLHSLRHLLAGGDVLSVSHVRRAIQELNNCQVINGYGPTENTTFTCCYVINDLEKIENSVPIGRPIANTQVYILDTHMQPVPIGVPGELYAGGAGVARGYHNRDELTSEKFIPNPYGVGKLYRTGDLARYLPDGNIEFLGRIDNQVKLSGFRIELGEIETTLSQHSAVQEATVILREDQPGQKQIVAYVVQVASGNLQSTHLRAHLKQKLPEYMTPSAFVFLDSLPLNPNGKVERSALPALTEVQGIFGNSHVSPQSKLEKSIAEVWQESLNLPKVGIHDNFFDIGGNSLLAIQLHATLQTKVAEATEISVTDLFHYSTIASLAEHLSGFAGHPNQTQPEASLYQASESRSQSRRDALVQRATRQRRGRSNR